MRTHIKTNVYQERQKSERASARRKNFRRVLRRILTVGSFTFAFCAFAATTSPHVATAQSTSSAQLVIDASQSANTIADNVTSVVFEGDFTLTLIDGQVLRPVLLSRTNGAALVLGNTTKIDQEWTIVSNSPSWTGTIVVNKDNDLIVDPGVSNPLGAYSEENADSHAKLVLYNGSTFQIPQELTISGATILNETRMGRLATGYSTVTPEMVFAEVNIGAGQVLTVENGVEVDDLTGLTKTGDGMLRIVANGSGTLSSTNTTGYTPIDLGDVFVADGTLSVVDGTADVDDVGLKVETIALGDGATLDIQSFEAITLGGDPGDIVFEARDGSTVNFYIDMDGDYTKYVATTYNTYVNIGDATLDIDSDLPGVLAPKSLVLFSTANVGQTTYDPLKLTITDNILGMDYGLDLLKSTSDAIVVTLVESDNFSDYASPGNSEAVAHALDDLVDSGKYTPAEYAILTNLENNMASLDYNLISGELYASSVAFHFMNNLMTQQALFNNLRNNALVSYTESGASAVSPQDYDAGRINTQAGPNGSYPLNYGGAANGNFDRGPLYYNTDTNSYAPGVVPTPQPQPVTGIYNGEYIGGYGDTNSYGMIQKQFSTLRGQEAKYGDPGTLIYSAWAEFLGSALKARVHRTTREYKAKQAGVLAGLDLFGSCDCRFGVYYGYQYNELDSMATIGYSESNEHQLGLYHQFGDENVYNIGTIHGGYARYDTKRLAEILTYKSTLKGRYDTWNAGVTFERGMNFKMNPLTVSPYAQIDYNYFNRHHFEEKTDAGPEQFYKLRVNKGNYHSLRGQVGGRIALDMYPGEQQLRIVFNAAYIHEFLDGIYGKTRVSFLGLPSAPAFDIYGNSLGRDWAVLGLGGEWAPIPALDLFARGDYILNKYTRNPGGSAGLKYRW